MQLDGATCARRVKALYECWRVRLERRLVTLAPRP